MNFMREFDQVQSLLVAPFLDDIAGRLLPVPATAADVCREFLNGGDFSLLDIDFTDGTLLILDVQHKTGKRGRVLFRGKGNQMYEPMHLHILDESDSFEE